MHTICIPKFEPMHTICSRLKLYTLGNALYVCIKTNNMLNNQCVIQIVNGVATLSFSQIVEKANVKIWDESSKRTEPIIIQEIIDSNFESFKIPNQKGRLRFEISNQNKTIIKTINNL